MIICSDKHEAIELMRKLSKTENHEVILDCLEYYGVFGVNNLTVSQMNYYINKMIKGDLMEKIRIKYHSDEIEKLRYIDGKSDWIDLRAAEDISFKKGEFKMISLGISMKLPDGYEAHVVPRSSTFKTWGLLQTNSMGVIDQSYSGTNDIWHFPALATRDTEIHVNDRICQFRIVENQPQIMFDEVDELDDVDRGGFGSTGKQ